jgi:hypothetical protein
MSREIFQDECPGCRPAVVDVTTGEPMPDDSPLVRSVQRVWARTQRFEREAFHRVTCLNSRQPTDMAVCSALMSRIENAASEH